MPRRHEHAVSQLIGELVRGEPAEGERLPPEQELAERLGVSRGTVRHALQALEARGMVAVVPGSGPVVRPDDRWHLGEPDVLLAVLDAARVPGLAAEAIATRTVLESDAAAGACARASEGDLRLLAERVEGLGRAAGSGEHRTAALDDAFVQAERDFHHALALIGGNRVAASVSEPLHAVLATLRLRRAPDREHAVMAQHRRILEGVSSRDPELAISAVQGYGRLLERWVARRS